MAPATRVNNLQIISKPFTDIVSKIFIVIELVLGINRFTLLGTNKFFFLILPLIYTVFLNCFILYMTISTETCCDYTIILKMVQYMICGVFGFLFRNKLKKFYSELNNFDVKIGLRLVAFRSFSAIAFHMAFAIILSLVVCIKVNMNSFPMIMYLLHTIENHYYAYLFELLIQKLKWINCCIKSTLVKSGMRISTGTEKHKLTNNDQEIQMSKLMDLYYIIINAYEALTDAIKWQMFFTIITSFIQTLLLSYIISESCLILNKSLWNMSPIVGLCLAEAIPLVAPCMSCDGVRAEVHKLKELLASKLYESNLDKASRGVTRALLALTENRNLSVTLFRVMTISISLPFSFLGLLATYLIIMLQFGKVMAINLANTTTFYFTAT